MAMIDDLINCVGNITNLKFQAYIDLDVFSRRPCPSGSRWCVLRAGGIPSYGAELVAVATETVGAMPGVVKVATLEDLDEAFAIDIERESHHTEARAQEFLGVGRANAPDHARGHRDVVAVVGHAATIAAGEWITASGEWVNDRTHGQQFKARFLRTSPPTSPDGIEKYLSSGWYVTRSTTPAITSCD